MSKMVQGVGINDADYVVKIMKELPKNSLGKRQREVAWRCPYYTRWKSMLDRCYDSSHHKIRPGYTDCIVSEEWKTFSNFKAWMEKQVWEGRHLDKDLLIPGNKVYSADTCVFILPLTNTFVNSCTARRGKYPLGVSWDIAGKNYRARLHNPFTDESEWLGAFDSPKKAHLKWVERKLELSKCVADAEDDERVKNALVTKYENFKDFV